MKTGAKVLIGLVYSDYRSDPGRLGYPGYQKCDAAAAAGT